MTKLDQFESTFRAASKEVFVYEPVRINKTLVITDLAPGAATSFVGDVRKFLSAIDHDDAEWIIADNETSADLAALLNQIESEKPDLIATYRHLYSQGWRWPVSLGEHLDVLTQATATPVLVIPHPEAEHAAAHSLTNTSHVMAITDHLLGEASLINSALSFTAPQGTCWLSHIEAEARFERYMTAISKLPQIDTETAWESLESQLLKEPHDYVKSCRAAIEAAEAPIKIEEIVTMGRRLDEYSRLIDEHEVDLLLMRTKDEDQLAMHGLAYPLAVELRKIPLLML